MTTKVYWRGANGGVLQPSPVDVNSLFESGANLVRIVIYPYGANDWSAEEWKNCIREQLNALDSMLHFGNDKKKFCIEIHIPPGGVNADGKARMWIDRPWGLTCLKEMWVEIANRYKEDKRVHVYDILNEPACPNNDKIQAMYVDIIKAIRKINSTVRISVSTAYGSIPTSEPFRAITALKDKNIWYQIHVYKPMGFTHQGVYDAYPIGPQYPTDGSNKTKLKAWLNVTRKFQVKYDANIFLGEFCASVYAENSDAIQYMKDVISICEEWGWQWCHLSWDHTGPWNTFRSTEYIDTLVQAFNK